MGTHKKGKGGKRHSKNKVCLKSATVKPNSSYANNNNTKNKNDNSNPVVTQTALVKLSGSQNKPQSHESGKGTGMRQVLEMGKEMRGGGKREQSEGIV